jgi:glycosyltransferase involved in cell wall biosynthesis
MKIAIDARIISLSTGRYVERLLDYLPELDAENEYIVLLLAKDFKRWEPKAKNFTKMVADFPIYSPAEQLQFAKLLYGLEVDFVHFTMPQHPLAYLRPFMVTVHDVTLLEFVNKRGGNLLRQIYSNILKPAIFKLVMWKATRWALAVITPTKFVRARLLERYKLDDKRVHVTYEAADPLVAKPVKADYGQGDEFIMYVGNAYPYKNLWHLIQAFHKLGRPGLKLVMVGKKDYFYSELEKKTKTAGIEDVIFAGFVPDENLAWLYQHAKLYVFASLSEGFGLPPLEAMQYGLPVLSSNASCMPEVYGRAAEYFDPKDAGNLAQKIDWLLEHPERLEQLSEAGLERVKQYSWRRMAEQTLEIYKKFRV